MLILTNATLWNPGVLETRSLPKKFLGRVLVAPLTTNFQIWGRLLVEMQVLRYSVTLLPFAISPILVAGLAVPVMQAPALMVMLVVLVELKVLRLTASDRAAQVEPDEAARRLDTLSFRARTCLRRIAARHDLREGALRLVVEQSELEAGWAAQQAGGMMTSWMLHGRPGVGKTELVQDLAKRIGAELYDLGLTTIEPQDLRGLPYYDHATAKTVWYRPEDLPDTEAPAILFLDELTAAAPSLQPTVYGLL